ncbi:GDSL esterase/lipase 5-like, partial [Prunus avium]|uniref:GDSL esterase/lipase 5-like n=1 Tax=Prunus avium TaxID=42229 RepID=A0A6P5T0B0_PRUAV
MASFRFQIYILALCAGLVIQSSCHGHSGLQKKHVALFIFGDSLYDPGNNNYINTTKDFQANWLPYGETFFRYPTGRFSDGRLIPDFIGKNHLAIFFPYGETFFSYPTGRFSDGRLIPDFIAEYAKLPYSPPFLQPGLNNYTYGVNFASAGAGSIAETHQGY